MAEKARPVTVATSDDLFTINTIVLRIMRNTYPEEFSRWAYLSERPLSHDMTEVDVGAVEDKVGATMFFHKEVEKLRKKYILFKLVVGDGSKIEMEELLSLLERYKAVTDGNRNELVVWMKRQHWDTVRQQLEQHALTAVVVPMAEDKIVHTTLQPAPAKGPRRRGAAEKQPKKPSSRLLPARNLRFELNSGIVVDVVQSDITKEEVTCIVNATNSKLEHPGGVSFTIARTAGPSLVNECRAFIAKNGPLRTAGVAVTTAGNLPCKKVIHAVGPIRDQYQSDADCGQVLREAFSNILEAADQTKTREAVTLSMPLLSTGANGVSRVCCCDALWSALTAFQPVNGRLKSIRVIDISVPSITEATAILRAKVDGRDQGQQVDGKDRGQQVDGKDRGQQDDERVQWRDNNNNDDDDDGSDAEGATGGNQDADLWARV